MLAKRIIGKVMLSGFLAVFICIAIPTNGTAQPWYDSDWSYRMKVIIDNSSNPSTLTDYQVKVLLDNTNFDFSRAQSGGEDIRFTDSDGTTLINHWIESWDSVAESAIVWVKVPNIPASDSTTIYMYYGNTAASSSSNGSQTFLLFDDWSKPVSGDVYGNWQRVVVDNSLDGSHNVLVEDVDGDTKPDLVVDAYRAEVVVWYQGPTDPVNDSWAKYTIDPHLANAHDIQIGDIDGDGRRDIVGLSLSESWTNYSLGTGYVCWYQKPVDPTTTGSTGWTEKAPIPDSTADMGAALYNGKLYIFGGHKHGTPDTRDETFVYYLSSDTWAQLTDMPTARWGPVAVEFDGLIHVFAGMIQSTATGIHEIYDPSTDTWASSALGNPLDIPEYGASGAVHPDVLYFLGGKDGYKYWMVYTPYPPASEENPSILRSNDGITWTDAGVSNPVILPGSPGEWNAGENADPDFIYVSGYNKWFMVWAGQDESGSEGIALAYSSDGKTWTEYDGITINGNANPVILSGEDTDGQTWEVTSGGISKLQCPTLLYESDTFYLYYVDEVPGNNRGSAGFATFTWNNVTNDVENLMRYASNPTIDLPADADFNSGCGHLDLSKNPNDTLYYMYVVRQLAGSSSFELALLTSTDMISWTNQGKVLERGAPGEWDDQHIYRSCPVVDSTGNIVFFDTKIQLYYSAFGTGGTGIGIANIPETGPPEKFDGNGPSDVPSGLANQGLMGIRYGDRIHLFYKQYHYEYDPVTDTYTPRANVPTPRTWGTCALVNDSIYIIGGYSYDTLSGATNVNEVYDPVSDTWTTKTAMPVSKYGVTRENPVINGIIYVTHGLNGGFHTDNYAYEPATDTWEQKSSAVHPRDGVGCCVFNNKLYVVGGRDDYISGGTGTNYVEEYDPLNDSPGSSWTKTVIARSGDPGLLGARACGLGDIDSDGDLDIAVAVDRSPGRLYWYQNPGDSAALDSSLWNEYLIDDTQARGADAQVGDIDKDGNPDIVYAEVPSNLYIYFAPADPTNIGGWSRVSVAGDCYHVYLVDFDGDGDLDILRAAPYSALVSWLENPYPTDPRTPANWNEYIIEQNSSISIANRVMAADIDGDGDLDIGMDADPSGSAGIFKWYRRPDDPTDVDAYEIYVIDDDPAYTAYAHDSYLADIDMDSDIDMAGVGPNAQGGTVVWWINDTTSTDTIYIDPNKWSNGGATVSDSILTVSGANLYIRSQDNFLYKALRAKGKFEVYANYGYIGYNSGKLTVGQNDATFLTVSGNVRSITSDAAGFTWGYDLYEGTDWRIWEVLWKENEAKFYVDNTLRYTHITNVPSVPLTVQFNTYQGSPTVKVDWVLVRNYSTPEPTTTTGQSSGQGAKVYLSPASDTIALDSLGLENIDYDDMGSTAQPLKGYDIKITFDPTIIEVDTAYSGGFLGASSAFFWEILGTDTVKVTEARLDTGGVSGSGTLATIVFRGIGGGTTPLEYASVSLRDTLNDPISATTQAGSLSVDGYLPTMKPIVEAEGQYYNSAPSLSTFGFDDNWGLDDGFYQMDSYAGTWLSLFTDCPDTTWDSTGWAIPGFGALSEGSHTIYFMATDDAANREGESGEWSWQFYKDTTAPGSVTGFTAEPGHNKVSMSWTNAVGALEGILIRRAAWNDYPQYDTAAPAYPGSTTAGDSVAFLSPNETTYIDTLPARDIYYYTVFTRDSAGNYSSADTLAQDRSTSYWLGDVTDGSGVGNYDGYVDFEDLMIFSGCFGTSEGDAGWEPEFDIGPTDDSSRTGIPMPDDVIDFEDLMIFAMNFWMVEPLTQSAKMPSEEALAVELELPSNAPLVGEEFEAKLIINNGAGAVKGMHLVIDFDSNSLEFIGVQESDLLKSQEAKVFFKATNANGKLDISMAILGTGVTLAESGEIAILRFKLLSDQVTEIKLSTVDLRDSSNHKLRCNFESAGIVGTKRLLPKVYALHQNYPNPFSVSTDINYQIPEDSKVIMQIYDLTGQLVCNILNKTQPAGYHTLRWNGKDKTGNEVAPGVYFCRLVVQPVHDGSVDIGKTSSHTFIKKMILIKRGRL